LALARYRAIEEAIMTVPHRTPAKTPENYRNGPQKIRGGFSTDWSDYG